MANERGYWLGPKGNELLNRMLDSEGGVRAPGVPGAPGPAPWLMVRVTSPGPAAGWFTGEVLVPDGSGGWDADATCLVRSSVGAALQDGAVYPAVRTGGDANDEPTFAALDLEALVRVKSPTPDANGLYDACLVSWNVATHQWDDAQDVWVRDLNP